MSDVESFPVPLAVDMELAMVMKQRDLVVSLRGAIARRRVQIAFEDSVLRLAEARSERFLVTEDPDTYPHATGLHADA